MNLVGRGFARDAFTQALSAEAFVRAMLDFERALAAAEADAGLVPRDAADLIGRACSELSLQPDALAGEAKRSGSLAVPLVKALTEHVARIDGRAAAFVHYGSTSQDVLDTALALFLDHGFNGVSMDQLVASAGGSKATLYRYFDSKEALFEAIIDDIASGGQPAEEDEDWSTTDLREGLDQLVRGTAAAALDERTIVLMRLALG